MLDLFFAIAIGLSFIIWFYLILFRGNFWLCDQFLKENRLENKPNITAIIPARNEAEVLPESLTSLLNQDYAGEFNLVLVDDRSSDGTGQLAQQIASNQGKSNLLAVIKGEPLPANWTGKLWAMKQGIDYANSKFKPDYFLLTDADIKHSSNNLTQLIAKAGADNLDLVSLMVLLRCESFWERLLIPAFIFFFQKLYPFPWVNNPAKKVAAAAGGCILIKAETLGQIGGIEVLKEALIDDCTLASYVKNSLPDSRSIWLGLTNSACSLRAYPDLKTIWQMVARTAFTQLNYSIWLLSGTLLGMFLTYLAAPLGVMIGTLTGKSLMAIASCLVWLLMAICYYPTLRLYRLSPLWAIALPGIACLYSLMTVDSALLHWQGKGGQWKGRVYQTSPRNQARGKRQAEAKSQQLPVQSGGGR